MSYARWQKIESVLQEALDLPAASRAAYLNGACGGDADLHREATSLIDALEHSPDFIEEPAIFKDARVLASDLPDPNIGRVIGAYKILEHLGSGGMGEVYRAEDSRLGRSVALKILPDLLVSDATLFRRFQTEARAASALNHPNVLTVHEVGEVDGAHFIATEFIDGETIRELTDKGDLTIGEVLDICIQVGTALASAHAAGIIHRDIKPENIMRRSDGLVKVLDFGIAKPTGKSLCGDFAPMPEAEAQYTEMGVVLGTVGYMSPEQARGLPVNQRTDIWSLGVVFYELLARRAPFGRETRMDTLVSILEHEPQPVFTMTTQTPALIRSLQQIVTRSLTKDPGQRYQTVEAMLEELKECKKEFDRAILLGDETTGGWLSRTSITRSETSEHSPQNIVEARTRLLPSPLSSATSRGASWKALVIGAAILLGALFLYGFYLSPVRERSTRLAATASATKLYREMSEPERLAFVAEQEQRISAMLGDRQVQLDQDALMAIKGKVDSYVARKDKTSNGVDGETLSEIYERATPYIPLIARSFEAQKVPVTVGIYLPMIEAEYHPCSVSPIGAKGLFQFLPQTAMKYGVSPKEMCDAEKMTPAAAHYIADRMAELGEDSQSLTLVLLSYNRGVGWVQDTLRKLRGTDKFQRNFWTLLANRDKLDESFRNESAGYVPRFFAAAIIGENPRVFELQTPPLSSLK